MSRTSILKGASSQAARKAPIRRAVRIEARNGDQVIGKTKSFTQTQGVEYHPSIDCQSFEFHCDCKDHECRKRVCKHLKRLALSLVRRGELPAIFFERAGLTCCHHCGGVEGLYPMCDERGARIFGVSICRECIANLNTKGATPQEITADTEDEAWEMPEEPLGYVEESTPDEKRREIAQLREFADALDGYGEGFSAAQARREANHKEQLLGGGAR